LCTLWRLVVLCCRRCKANPEAAASLSVPNKDQSNNPATPKVWTRPADRRPWGPEKKSSTRLSQQRWRTKTNRNTYSLPYVVGKDRRPLCRNASVVVRKSRIGVWRVTAAQGSYNTHGFFGVNFFRSSSSMPRRSSLTPGGPLFFHTH
jgi:hypothetical protein